MRIQHLCLVLLAAACVPQPETRVDQRSADEKIAQRDNPAHLLAALGLPTRWLLSDVISTAEVGRFYKTSRVPYPDDFWPYDFGGIDANWNWKSRASPLQKYMAVFSPHNSAAAASWENRWHGLGLPNLAHWMGHCNGWVAAAISNDPLSGPINVKRTERGVASCTLGEIGCVHFEIGDINALEAEAYFDAPSVLIGARCDARSETITHASGGRIQRKNGCQGLNAGSLLVLLANMIKFQDRPIALDIQDIRATEEIWNQPVFGYTVYASRPLALSEASDLVWHGSNHYPWNESAQGFVFVNLGISYVNEVAPSTEVVDGMEAQKELRVAAVIELDADPSNPNAHIIGGEYVDAPSLRARRLDVPPFAWVPLGVASVDLPPSTTDNMSRNPYVKPRNVTSLIALAQGRVSEVEMDAVDEAVADSADTGDEPLDVEN